jgi:hypothetical protein
MTTTRSILPASTVHLPQQLQTERRINSNNKWVCSHSNSKAEATA